MLNLSALTKNDLIGIIKGFKPYLDNMVEIYPNVSRLKEVRSEFLKRFAGVV